MSKSPIREIEYYDIGKATGYERAISDVIVLFGEAMALNWEDKVSLPDLLLLIEPSMRANVKEGRLLDRA